MKRSFFQFAFLLFLGVLYETAANVVHHRRHRHHRQISEPTCISTFEGYLCSNQEYYPFESVSDAVNEVREILSSRSTNKTRLRELDPEVYNFHTEPRDVVIQNLPENVGDCETEIEEMYPQEGRTISKGRSENFFIVNIPSLRQSVVSIRCNCQNSVNHDKCGQVFQEERLLSLSGHKRRFNIKDFSIQTYLIPYGCSCSN